MQRWCWCQRDLRLLDLRFESSFSVDTESDGWYFGIMKTTVEIPDDQLRDLVRFTRAKTKRAAIVAAIEDFNQRRRMAALIKHSGTFRSLLTNDEIEALENREAYPAPGRPSHLPTS